MEGHERFLHFHIASLGPAFSPGARRFLALTIDNGMPMMSDIARSSEKSFGFPAHDGLVTLRYQRAER